MSYTVPVDEPGFDFRYVETSIPAGVTMREYRRTLPRRPTRRQRLTRLASSILAPPDDRRAT
jgi:hypothetical protein